MLLDRFTIAHPQSSSLTGGRWECVWSASGSVGLQALLRRRDQTKIAEIPTAAASSSKSSRFAVTTAAP